MGESHLPCLISSFSMASPVAPSSFLSPYICQVWFQALHIVVRAAKTVLESQQQ